MSENTIASASPTSELSTRQLFEMHLGDLCIDLAQLRKEDLIEQVRTLALQRAPLSSDRRVPKSFWDEYALLLANDHTYLRNLYDHELQLLCHNTLERLSDFERTLLEKTTEQYREFWREDKDGPADDDARGWLMQEMCDALTRAALNHGELLLDVD